MKRIDASNLKYNVLNDIIRRVIEEGENKIIIDGVCGQYYIGCGIAKPVEIVINGVPGNDLGAFMEGPTIIVNEDAQDGIGNTMSSGEIIIHGNAGDVLGYSMRGGSIFVKGNVGYRACIHMKAYKEDVSPTVVIGGCAGAFMGEYMAGGTLILLGLNRDKKRLTGNYLGTGMHGGAIFIRQDVDESLCSREVLISKPDDKDMQKIITNIKKFCDLFGFDCDKIIKDEFVKITPKSKRPYGNLYIPGP
ncbi:MAG: hypothetical protein ACP5LU_03105 [Desulfurella sp.]|uniref:GltB/FmdC/FwdC-like GXGXG domain-containing protein n=1 Tax=Desulfurella sp. TaxID=1962857 RepID=UPI003D12769E